MTRTVQHRIQFRSALLCCASAAVLALLGVSTGASAQDAAAQNATSAPAPQAADSLQEVMVTSTRVLRDGYNAPTPTTVIGVQEIEAKAPANLADLVNQFPAMAGSVTPRDATPAITDGNAGINALNLRNFGANRTLVLLDGQRVGASTTTGLVDINQFPQGLIERVDVVTGGASADWGSDAVAGVVNFVLDKNFTGLKGEAGGGITTYGDDKNRKISLTAGTKFAGDRGHLLLSGEAANDDGVNGIGSRSWYNYDKILTNPNYTPTNGQPQSLTRANSGFSDATPGGIITSGPLKGTYFGPHGVPAQFSYGPLVSGDFMQGGQYKYADWGTSADLDAKTSRQSIFGRASYDLTDHVEIYAQVSWGLGTSRVAFGDEYSYGDTTVQADNAFLPASVAAQAAAAGVTSFNMGTFYGDIGPLIVSTRRTSLRPTVGANGDFTAFGSRWRWDAYYESTFANSLVEATPTNNANLTNAIDSVRAPNGSIVCRVTLSNPNSGCVPFNLFGTGVNNQAAIDYARGDAWLRTNIREQVTAANLRGDPFSTWAGPVSIATGVEHRTETVSGSVDTLNASSYATALATGQSRVSPYWAGNYLPTFGSYNVTEGYFQTVVPLATEMSFAKGLDLTAGVRETDYSTSGLVTTWKAGLTYIPIDDVTFRVTRSHDIRAPNLSELFQTNQTIYQDIVDPTKGLAPSNVPQITSGSKTLVPEVADSFSPGIVLQPRFIPGFEASVDYWNTDFTNAITVYDAQTSINQCAAGNTAFCSKVSRNAAGAITAVFVQPINLAKLTARGLDFEASYRHPLAGGNFWFRGLATLNLQHITNDGITAPIDRVGTNSGNGDASPSLPRYSYNATIGWELEPVSVQFTARGVSSGVYDTSFIQCSSNCPASTPTHMTVDNDSISGATYFDFAGNVKLGQGIESYLTIDNILNTSPPAQPWVAGGAPLSANASLYDVLGRSFRAGVRFKM